MASKPLQGFTVGVTADRRREEQAELLHRLGARVVHGPTVRTLPLADARGLLAATESLVATPPDVVLITTAIGVRGWIGAAESQGIDHALLRALRASRVYTRGPKAAGAVVTAGLEVSWSAPTEQSRELVEHVLAEGIDGMRIAVQLDGGTTHSVPDTLRAAGADVVAVPVYVWTEPDDPAPAHRMVDATVAGRLDAVTFTSSPAIWNFLAAADEADALDRVVGAFNTTVVACCVGPVCAVSAGDHGITRVVQPRRGRLGAMVAALGAYLVATGRTFALAGQVARLQGASLSGPDGQILLTDRERAVMEQLTARPGAVVSKDSLLQQAWSGLDADAHTVEVTIGRLRRRLGGVGGRLETIPRRGYRLVP